MRNARVCKESGEEREEEREQESRSSSDEYMQVPRDCHAGKSRLIGSLEAFMRSTKSTEYILYYGVHLTISNKADLDGMEMSSQIICVFVPFILDLSKCKSTLIHGRARSPDKATSRMSKWKARGAVHVLSRKFSGYKKSTRGGFFQVISPCSSSAANRFLQGFIDHIVFVRSVRHDPHGVEAIAGAEDGDGEIRKRVNTSSGGSQSGVSLARSYSVLQRKERQVRSSSGVHLVHKNKEMLGLWRTSITSRSTTDPTLPSRNP